MSFLINSYAYATGGGGADVIPDLPLSSIGHTGPEYKFASYDPFLNVNSNVATRITGINQPITLKIANWDAQGNIDLHYTVVTSLPSGWQSEYPANWGDPLINGSTFTVNNNDYIIFGGVVINETGSYCYAAFSILNNSDSDTALAANGVNTPFYTEYNC